MHRDTHPEGRNYFSSLNENNVVVFNEDISPACLHLASRLQSFWSAQKNRRDTGVIDALLKLQLLYCENQTHCSVGQHIGLFPTLPHSLSELCNWICCEATGHSCIIIQSQGAKLQALHSFRQRNPDRQQRRVKRTDLDAGWSHLEKQRIKAQ